MPIINMENYDVPDELVSKELVDKVLKQFYRVYNDLGYGFLEKVYQNALYYALLDEGLDCNIEYPVNVYHNNRVVGEYRADLIVEGCLIIETKATSELSEANEKLLINYLRATDVEVGYLLNFGKRPEFRRKVFSNSRKLLWK